MKGPSPVTLWLVVSVVVVVPLPVAARTASQREKALQSLLSDYTGNWVADAWAGFIWNRFPAEAYPLFLSPFIEAGRVQEAQEWSLVQRLTPQSMESYSGYITVDPRFRSNLFFWFFPAQTKRWQAPVLLWLNGGPGRTSLVGALMENGPLRITKTASLERQAVTWTQNFSMLYVDNPVGAGYSFTMDKAGLSRTMRDVSRNLYSFLIQFFKLFPQFANNEFYVGGQSYAGKYVPSLGCYIHDKNNDMARPPEIFINFKGIYLGAGFCDPERMLATFPDFLYHSGLISNSARNEMRENFTQAINDTREGDVPATFMQYEEVFTINPVINMGVDSTDTLLGAHTTNAHLMRPLDKLMRSPAARIQLHVGYAQVQDNMVMSLPVADSLREEFLVSTSPENAFLMDNYKVLHYSGNLDVIVNVPMTEAFLEQVAWSGQQQYRQHHRDRWMVNDKLAGWFVTIGNFTRVIVRNSGHMVPYDQPEAALDMMQRFIFDIPFSTT